MDRIKSQNWQPIEAFPEWLVSDNGDILHEWTMKIMTNRVNRQGFAMVNLQDENRKIVTRSVALLVAKAHLGKPENPAYNSVIHLNGDRTDCRLMNLMWRPRWYGVKYHQMFDDEPYRVGAYIPRTKERFDSLRELCTTYGLIERNTFVDSINGHPCFHYGWIIERIEK